MATISIAKPSLDNAIVPDLRSADRTIQPHSVAKKYLLPVVALCASAFAQTTFAQARTIEDVALDPTWLRLTHLEKRAIGGYKTDIQSSEFHLSQRPLSPLAELKATIAVLNREGQDESATHAVCRFPARALWLKRNLPDAIVKAPSLVTCAGLNAWPARQSETTLNLVHVSGYMGNPGSAFGHLLLRAGKKDADHNRGLLDTGINFGAKIPPDEGTFMYIVKGVGGGYSSSFSADRHYLRDHIYAASEARDMWAYELNLSEVQRELLLLHLWELRETEFNYFFLKKNCAWRVAQLLELVLEKNILPRRRLYYMPVDVFHAVEELDSASNNTLVNKIVFLPSDKRSITIAFDNLSESKKLRMRDLIVNPQVSGVDESLTPAELELLIDYSALVLSKKSSASKTASWKKLRQKALLLRLKSKSKPEQMSFYSLPPPGEGLRHQILQTSVVKGQAEDLGLELSFAPFSYELLDRNRGSLANGEFRGGVFTFSSTEGHTRLESLDILKIARIRGTSRLDNKTIDTAWRAGLQINREWPSELGKLVPQFYGGIGKTLGKGSTAFFNLLEVKTNLKDLSFQGGLVVGAVSTPGIQWSFSWESSIYWSLPNKGLITRHTLSTRHRFSRAHAIELAVESEHSNIWKLRYQYRW